MIIKYRSLLLVLLCSVQFIFAQECDLELTGKVLDFHNGEPLSNAVISFDDTIINTDIDGQYTLTGLCPKIYTVTVEHIECNSKVVYVNPKDQTFYNFSLEHHSTDLTTINLHATGDHDSPKSIVEKKLSKKTLERYRSKSLGDALTEITGVNSLNTGSTVVKPVIQGLHSSRVLMINNGVRQQDQEWGVEHAPNMDLNAFENIKVVKGAGALQYGGDAIGGVVITESKMTSIQDTIFGRANLSGSTNGRGGMVGALTSIGFKNGWSAKVQGNAKRFGDVEAPEYILSNTGIEEKTFSVGIRNHSFLNGIEAYYSLFDTEQGILAASHIGNITDLVTALNSADPLIIRDFTYDIAAPKQKTQHHLAKLKAYHRFNNLGKWSLQYAYQANHREEFDVRRRRNAGRASVDLKLLTHTLETTMLLDGNDKFTKNIGMQVEYQENIPNPSTGIRRLIPDYKKTTAGIYAVGDLHLNEQWSVDAGIRYDYIKINAQKFYKAGFWNARGYDREFSSLIRDTLNNQFLTNPILTYHNTAFSGGVHYEFRNTQELSLSTSLVNRAPNPVELFSDGLHHSASIVELGDLGIQQEQALKFALNYTHNSLFKNAQLSIAPHYSYINDYILLEPSGLSQTTRGAFLVWEYRQTKAFLLGVDIDLVYAVSKSWNFHTGFSYIYGQDKTLDKPLIQMPAPNFSSEMNYSHNRWNIALKHQLVLRQERFPDNNFTATILENGVNVTPLIDISSPPKGYQLFDIITNYEQPLGKNTLGIALQVHNVLNTSYRSFLNRQRYYSNEVGRNIQVNLQYKF